MKPAKQKTGVEAATKKISHRIRTRIEKKNISVDHPQQHQEKNVWWGDFPAYNTRTGRKLRKTLCYYFDSWEDYIEHGGEDTY